MNQEINIKSKQLLLSFTKYCLDHPEERFYQALRHWMNVPFVCIAKDLNDWGSFGLEDTFYWTRRNQVKK